MDVVKGRDLSGQVHLLTGGDTGIGYQAALALGSAKASLILASYNADHGKAACANITKLTGAGCSAVGVDLSSFASVRSCAAAVLALTDRIDVAMWDAGIACVAQTGKYAGHGCAALPPMTSDGYERVIEVNYLGHFLFTELLLPTLRKSKARVINVASSSSTAACTWSKSGMGTACLDTDKLEKLVTTPVTGNNLFQIPASNYGNSKYMQVFHARELQKREGAAGVTAFSLHPGVVGTDMMSAVPKMTATLWCEGQKPCPFTPEEGAATPAYVAASPASELQPGKFYVDCTATDGVYGSRSNAAAYAQDLYDRTDKWVGSAPGIGSR